MLRNTYKLVRFLYSAVHIHVLQSNTNFFAILQLPALQLIFSATWVVLILALKIIVLREMT